MNRTTLNKIIISAIVSIPLITIFISLEQSPFQYTLSMIGNWFGVDDRIKFILWGIFTSLLLILALYLIYEKTKIKDKRAYSTIILSGIFLIATVLTPTLHRYPIPKDLRTFHVSLHTIFTSLFVIFLVSSLYIFSKEISKRNKQIPYTLLRFFIMAFIGGVLLLIIFGLTGVFELYFFISLSIALIIIEKIIEKKH